MKVAHFAVVAVRIAAEAVWGMRMTVVVVGDALVAHSTAEVVAVVHIVVVVVVVEAELQDHKHNVAAAEHSAAEENTVAVGADRIESACVQHQFAKRAVKWGSKQVDLPGEHHSDQSCNVVQQ